MSAHRQCIFCRHIFALAGDELPQECPDCGTDLPDDSFVTAVPAPFAEEGTITDLNRHPAAITDTPDEFDATVRQGYAAPPSVDLDSTDRLPALSVLHGAQTDELDATRIDNASLPTVQDSGDARSARAMSDASRGLADQPTVTEDASGNGASRANARHDDDQHGTRERARMRQPPRAPLPPLPSQRSPFQQDVLTVAAELDDTGQMASFDDTTFSQPTMDLDALAAAVVPDNAPSATPSNWTCPACGAEWTAVSTEACPACDWRND